MNFKSTLSLIILCTAISIGVNAQLYSYTNSTTGSYNAIAANTSAAGLIRFNGASAPSSACGSGFSSTGFSSTATYSSALAGVEADITASGGYELNITDFSVGLRRSGTGPADVRLAYSIDGGTTWIDKGSNDAPLNGSCGTTTTATWTTSITVPSPATLQFRVYAFDASGASGTFQILNLDINGTISTLDSIYTSPAAPGPFCDNMNDSISLYFTTTSGNTSGVYYAQISDASGTFPNDASSNLISTGDSMSPVHAIIPAYTPWANGYRVRVVQQTPLFYGSGDNGSNIVINHADTAAFSISADRSVMCAHDTVRLIADSIVNGGTSPTITWYLNNSATVVDTIYKTSISASTDSVYAILTSSALCATPAILVSRKIGFTVYQPAFISLFDTICPGTSVTFNGLSRTIGGNYMDTMNTVHGCDSIITLHLMIKQIQRDTVHTQICQGMSFTYKGQILQTAGLYSDTTSCDTIHNLALIVNNLPTPTITEQAGISSDTLSTGLFSSYQWIMNGQVISGAISDTFITGASTGHYSVLVTDSNGCSDTASSVLYVYDAIHEINSIAMNIYPNPTTGMVHIQSKSVFDIASLSVIDAMGRVIIKRNVIGESALTPIDLSTYGPGVYLIAITDANNRISSKVVSVIQK